MSRSAVFLDEMGVGPLWRLRQGAATAVVDEIVIEAPLAIADPGPEPEPVAEIAPPVVMVEPVSEPAVLAEDSSTAWFDDAPAPKPVTPVTDAEIAAMDWDALSAAVAKCTRCDLCKTRKGVVMGRGDRQAEWLMVASSPSRGEEREGRALGGEQGLLLDNMFKAMQLDAGKNVYITHLLKCRPLDDSGQERLPTDAESAACRPYFDRELALLQPRTIVTLGQMAAAVIIAGEKPVRGKVRELGSASVVATFHPDMLLQDETGKAKARAWADLCLAASTHAARA
ncbi:uracil-DNA glycosylase [Janthinobacterium psychrotolerans]|uniref:DNA polymerase n=1 Tax=Janthinobacterium psychrotolerans TaxID=1747903 RepID=A0A1A7C505_9BURK|nr:uracil-DNA glycosylase [Janthinobacterium psychrotolerans]OBV40782.1 DNA polymerase [Janthinobacterium psychrotolerans]